jgi:hypothetical protein
MPKGVYKRKEAILKRIGADRRDNPSCRGWNLSKETKKKISKALKGKQPKNSVDWRGENHPNWKGGISKNERWVSWRKNKRNRIKREAMGEHTFGEWELLEKQYNYTCPCCGGSEPEIKLTEDHIIPLSRGGSDNIENIQPLCRSCNCKKHTKIIKYSNPCL